MVWADFSIHLCDFKIILRVHLKNKLPIKKYIFISRESVRSNSYNTTVLKIFRLDKCSKKRGATSETDVCMKGKKTQREWRSFDGAAVFIDEDTDLNV